MRAPSVVAHAVLCISSDQGRPPDHSVTRSWREVLWYFATPAMSHCLIFAANREYCSVVWLQTVENESIVEVLPSEPTVKNVSIATKRDNYGGGRFIRVSIDVFDSVGEGHTSALRKWLSVFFSKLPAPS